MRSARKTYTKFRQTRRQRIIYARTATNFFAYRTISFFSPSYHFPISSYHRFSRGCDPALHRLFTMSTPPAHRNVKIRRRNYGPNTIHQRQADPGSSIQANHRHDQLLHPKSLPPVLPPVSSLVSPLHCMIGTRTAQTAEQIYGKNLLPTG